MIKIGNTLEETYFLASTRIRDIALESVRRQGKFCIALAGGQTPIPLYKNLAEFSKYDFPWDKTFLFLSDERILSLDSEKSNFRMINNNLLKKIPIVNNQVFRIEVENELPERLYEKILTENCLIENDLPTLDLCVLGVGQDGHTASLFTTEATTSTLVTRTVALDGSWRISLGSQVLNNSRHVMFFVTGGEKAQIVREVLQSNMRLPASLIKGRTSTEWYLDKEAAREIESMTF